jgi:hypothetical protein
MEEGGGSFERRAVTWDFFEFKTRLARRNFEVEQSDTERVREGRTTTREESRKRGVMICLFRGPFRGGGKLGWVLNHLVC